MIPLSQQPIQAVSSKWKWIFGSSILTLLLFFFVPTFQLGFLFDDWGELGNARWTAWPPILNNLSPNSPVWRTMYYIWWKSLMSTVGTRPVPYHVVHLIQHSVCTLWVYFLTRYLSRSERTGLAAAFFFSLHKVMAITVAWDSTIIDSFMVLFGIPTFFFYTFAVNATDRFKKLGWYLLCYAFSLLTLKSKLSAVMFPAMLVMFEFFWGGKGFIKNTIKRQWPIWTIYLIFAISSIPSLREPNPGYESQLGLISYWKGLMWYLSSTTLSDNQIHMAVYSSIGLNFVFISALGLAISQFRKKPTLIFGVLWFMISLFPVAILVTHHFDHHLYFPMVGASLFVGAATDWLLSKTEFKPWLTAVTALFLISVYFYRGYPIAKLDVDGLFDAHAKNERTLNGIKTLYPTFPEHTHFYFNGRPPASLMDNGSSLRILWNSISVKASIIPDPEKLKAAVHGDASAPAEDRFDPKTEKRVVLNYQDSGEVTDITKEFE